jgi:RNA polymerase sigma factor (TIGR02999 family)
MSNNMDVTNLIAKTSLGDKVSEEALFTFTYNKFKEIAKNTKTKVSDNEVNDIISSTTEIVHDAYLKLHPSVLQDIDNRREFFTLVAKTMRHILVDHYRKAKCQKRSSASEDDVNIEQESGFTQYVQIDNAIDKLNQHYPRQAQTLQIKYFLGFMNKEIAELYRVSESTIDKDLLFSKKWLRANAA